MLITIDREKRLDMGMMQAGWSDDYWALYPFKVKMTDGEARAMGAKQYFAAYGTPEEKAIYAKVRAAAEDNIRQHVQDDDKPGNGWGQLRWSGGSEVEQIIWSPGHFNSLWGAVMIKRTTMLAD